MARVLVCANRSRSSLLAEQLLAEDATASIVPVDNGIVAMGKFVELKADRVVIDGALDGRGGLRLAWALAQYRVVPTDIVVDPADVERVRASVRARGLEARVFGWARQEGKLSCPSFAVEPTTAAEVDQLPTLARRNLRPPLFELLSTPFDAVVLLGSAGTPHMLPTMLPRLRAHAVPLVVAVHHNARLSSSFQDWVSKLAGTQAEPFNPFVNPLPPLSVALADPKLQGLQPQLDGVVKSVLRVPGRVLVIVTSGMDCEGAEAVEEAAKRGAEVVAVSPKDCSQPGMVHRVLASGLKPLLCSPAEVAHIILGAVPGPCVCRRRAS